MTTSTVVDSSSLFCGETLAQELIHPRDRKALYARSLISHFQRDSGFVARVLWKLHRHRSPLEDLLLQKGYWANSENSVATLEYAVLVDYDGLSHPAAFQQLWGDLGPYREQIAGLTEALDSAEELAHEAGLRAPWTAPMIFGAWLRHLLRQRFSPPGLYPDSFRLWPSGSRTVFQAPPPIVIEYYWDPESKTRDAARAEMMKHVDAKLENTIRIYHTEGYERVKVRNVRRDVEATYLRISDPKKWSWRKLSERYEAKGAAATDDGVPLLSGSGVRRAVGRVLEILKLELPEKRRGRPPKRRNLPND